MAKKRKSAAAKQAGYRNRIKEHRRVKASEIFAHPDNWRTHPKTQAAVLEACLQEVGVARSLLGYDDPEWGLTLIDGHLRRDKYGDQEVEIEVLDVTREEAKKLLATIDPLAAMAETDQQALSSLLESVSTESDALQGLLDSLKNSEADCQPQSGNTDPDDVPDEVEPITKPGDLWLLGVYWECESCGKKYDYDEGREMKECPCG